MGDRRPSYEAHVRIYRSRISFQIEDRVLEFAVQDIQVIGEFTAPPGIMAADYFFSFKLRGREHPVDMPGETDGLFAMLSEVRKILPGIGHPKLQMSTDFASNVLYPAHVAGMAMFQFHQESKPLIDLPILRSMGSVQKVRKALNPEVMVAVF